MESLGPLLEGDLQQVRALWNLDTCCGTHGLPVELQIGETVLPAVN